jgi:hypothetical protein
MIVQYADQRPQTIEYRTCVSFRPWSVFRPHFNFRRVFSAERGRGTTFLKSKMIQLQTRRNLQHVDVIALATVLSLLLLGHTSM